MTTIADTDQRETQTIGGAPAADTPHRSTVAVVEHHESLAVVADPRSSLAGHRDLELPAKLPTRRAMWGTRRLMHYNRLAATVLALNAAVAVRLAANGSLDAGHVRNAVLANFLLTVLVRQQRVVNAFFAAATAIPTSWPLRIRRVAGKVYHFGGLHVGGAIATTVWFVAGLFVREASAGSGVLGDVVAYAIAALLVAMVATSIPRFRARFHDRFEAVHRFGGWSALVLFAAHSVITSPASTPLWRSPSSGVLAIAVISIASSWMTLRRVPVTYSKPSSHVVVAKFEHRDVFAGSSTALATRPLRDWHHFANVNTPGVTGFRLTISRAGDWTGDLIDKMPDRIWVKGIPTAGVGNIDKLFRSVLWVATGSGIGPCLPHLLAGTTPASLVWSTRDPRSTYGDELVDEILSVQPDAVVWDTTADGKPDLVRLAFAAAQRFSPEAVICISNKATTWSIVEAFEQRGIPAYGAIWDS